LFLDAIERTWGDGTLIALFAPSQVDNRAFSQWWARLQRSAASPGMARQLLDMISRTDLRAVLPTIRVPTLVIHMSGDRVVPIELGREVAVLIPGARFIAYDGADAYAWTHSTGLEDIEEFLTGRRGAGPVDRVLSTVLFTDIVGSTERASALGDGAWRELLDDHNRAVRAELEAWRGTEIKSIGDGFLATFDGPARAMQCAAAIIDAGPADPRRRTHRRVRAGRRRRRRNRRAHRRTGHGAGRSGRGAGLEHCPGPGDRIGAAVRRPRHACAARRAR
jgi:hypothetical protein